MDSDHTVSEAVLAAVAEREGVDETELETPLYEAIDPDALDDLFRDGRGHVSFQYAGYVVTIDHDRNIKLTPLNER
jgi:hypothetical protein